MASALLGVADDCVHAYRALVMTRADRYAVISPRISKPACRVVSGGPPFQGRQGLDYAAGISAANAQAQALCLHRLTMPPGARATAHLHAGHESAIYMISGETQVWWGPRLEHHAVVRPGDFLHIPAGVPHLPFNATASAAEAVIARTDPDEQESVIVLPELDALPHLPARRSA
jgi:uncharacterized RmlC-like cupin family protein